MFIKNNYVYQSIRELILINSVYQLISVDKLCLSTDKHCLSTDKQCLSTNKQCLSVDLQLMNSVYQLIYIGLYVAMFINC